jgi:hypothetical protein
MSKYNFEIEPEEILLDKLAKKKEEEIGILTKKFEVPIFKTTPFRFLLLLFFYFLFFIYGLFNCRLLKRKNLKLKLRQISFSFQKSKQRGE